MKKILFLFVCILVGGIITSCSQYKPTDGEFLKIPSEKTAPTIENKKETSLPLEAMEPAIRIGGKVVIVGEYFYVEPSLEFAKDARINLIAFDPREKKMYIEYANFYGVLGTEICNDWVGTRTVEFTIPSKKEFESGTQEACLYKNVCGPSWPFCFIYNDDPSNIEIVTPK